MNGRGECRKAPAPPVHLAGLSPGRALPAQASNSFPILTGLENEGRGAVNHWSRHPAGAILEGRPELDFGKQGGSPRSTEIGGLLALTRGGTSVNL